MNNLRDHLVQFYETDAGLVDAVGEFIAAPLEAGDAGDDELGPRRAHGGNANRGAATEPQTVLVGDDDGALRDLVRLTLEDEGYAVRTAPHGAAALEDVRQQPSDLDDLLEVLETHVQAVG